MRSSNFLLAIVMTIAATATVGAGPLLRIFRSPACGPNVCQVPQFNRVETVNDAAQAKPIAQPDSAEKAFVGPKQEASEKPHFEYWQTHGVESEKISDDPAERWTINGRRVDFQTARDALLNDDSSKLWLWLVGDGREAIEKDLAGAADQSLMGRTRVWSVPANHWSLYDRETGKPLLNTTGNPSICLTQPNGEILFQRDGYRGPADLEDLRKADPAAPKAPPKKPDPTPRPDDKAPTPTPAPTPAMPMIPLCCLVGGAGLILYQFAKGIRQ